MIIPNIDLQSNAPCVCCEFHIQDMNLLVYNKVWIMLIPNIDLQYNAMPICEMICMSSIVTYTQHRIYEFTSRIIPNIDLRYMQSMDNDYIQHRYELISICKVWIMIIPNIDSCYYLHVEHNNLYPT